MTHESKNYDVIGVKDMSLDDFEFKEDGLLHQMEGGYRFIQTDLGPLVKIDKTGSETGSEKYYQFDKDVLNHVRNHYRFDLKKINKHIHIQSKG